MMIRNKIFSEPETPITNYDGWSQKTSQILLFAAARATVEVAERKWKKFVTSVTDQGLSNKSILLMINHHDEENQWAPLHYAVHYNNQYVFEMLTSGDERFRCDINLNGGRGENVLHIAARSPNIWDKASADSNIQQDAPIVLYRMKTVITDVQIPKIVDRMISLGADINDEDDEGCTPLHIAVQYNRYNYVQALIHRGAKLRARTKLGENVLHFAFLPSQPKNIHDFTNIIDFIIKFEKDLEESDASLVEQVTIEGITPLAFAVCHQQITKQLAILVSDIQNEQLPGLLDFVARHCTKDLLAKNNEVREVLRSFVDRFLENSKTGLQLFHVICRNNNISLLQLFSEFLQERRRSSHYEARTLIDQSDHLGYTPLLSAVFYNAYECAECLMKVHKHHVNLLARTDDEDNILHICAKRVCDRKLFNFIWKNLIDAYKINLLQQMNSEKVTPLFAAVNANNSEVFKTLADYLKTIQTKSEDYFVNNASNTTICHEACKLGNIDILKKFISIQDETEIGNKLLAQDIRGYTCLHWAVAKNHLRIVKYLINQLHVEVDTLDDRRRTPFHLACEIGNIGMIVFLLKEKASTTMKNAQEYNGLEIAIVQQHTEAVKKLFEQESWRDMMRNSQSIEHTKAFDTPMRKLIRYLPEVALWLIDKKLTTTIGGPGQKVYKKIYDYEFYEDMTTVSKWCSKNERKSTPTDDSNISPSEFYTQDAYTLVRNHPLFISNEQSKCHQLPQHPYNDFLRLTKLRAFGIYLFTLSFFAYLIYLGLLTTLIFKGKPPHYFFNQANITMDVHLETCQSVIQYLVDNSDKRSEISASDEYRILKNALYVIMSTFIAKTIIVMVLLFPRGFFTLATYLETSALVLSYVYVLDWYPLQQNKILRCPVQYQLGAAGLLLSYINLLTYIRTAPILDLGVYVLMFQVITLKFFRFLPVLLIIICGFAFTFWMFLQDQSPYGTPIEAILRTSLMLFDLGYEDRLYKPDENGIVYYKIVYVVFMLTAVVFSIFVINLLIGLAVGEIPNLMTQGAIWRTHLMYRLTSDYEIMRIQFFRFLNWFACCLCCRKKRVHIMLHRYVVLEKDEKAGRMGMLNNSVRRFQHYFTGNIQEAIEHKATNE